MIKTLDLKGKDGRACAVEGMKTSLRLRVQISIFLFLFSRVCVTAILFWSKIYLLGGHVFERKSKFAICCK